jgi:hypothetical protein
MRPGSRVLPTRMPSKRRLRGSRWPGRGSRAPPARMPARTRPRGTEGAAGQDLGSRELPARARLESAGGQEPPSASPAFGPLPPACATLGVCSSPRWCSSARTATAGVTALLESPSMALSSTSTRSPLSTRLGDSPYNRFTTSRRLCSSTASSTMDEGALGWASRAVAGGLLFPDLDSQSCRRGAEVIDEGLLDPISAALIVGGSGGSSACTLRSPTSAPSGDSISSSHLLSPLSCFLASRI